MKNGRLFGDVWRFMQFVVIVLADVMTVCANAMIVSPVTLTVCAKVITVHLSEHNQKAANKGNDPMSAAFFILFLHFFMN